MNVEKMERQSEINFLGINFLNTSKKEVLKLIYNKEHRSNFEYLVTPNVDHINKIYEDKELFEIYQSATWKLNDSKIIQKLARFNRKNILTYPGSDLTRDLLEQADCQVKIGIIGPRPSEFGKLESQKYFDKIQLIDTPQKFNPGDKSWKESIDKASNSNCDILLVCLSFPKQELFCHELGKRSQSKKICICAGASIDFLTGKQKRAPLLIQKLSLEWLYRLLQNPKRMHERYINGIPKIIKNYIKYR